MQPPGQLIDVGGRRLHARLAGERRPTVVFESGGGGGSSAQDWPLQRRLASTTRTLAYDRAGLGWSDADPEPRSFGRMARDLHRLLGALGETGPVVLAGGSFGGLAAQTYARLFPDAVAGMVLVDACDHEKYAATMRRMRPFHEAELRSASRDAASGALRREAGPGVMAAAGLDDAERRALLHLLGRASHFEASLRELEVLDVGPPERAAAPPLGERPLIVIGHGRPYEGETAPWEEGWNEALDRLARLSSNSLRLTAEGCGHGIAAENPRLVAGCIEAVVEAVRSGAALEAEPLVALGGRPGVANGPFTLR